MAISKSIKNQLLKFQKNEVTEYHIYKKLAEKQKFEPNKKILAEIANDELAHYGDWRQYTEMEIGPNKLQIWFFLLISKLLGFTFAIKLMERSEAGVQKNYAEIRASIQDVDEMIRDENEHEEALIEMLDEERLRYVGSIVLGLNDALVELTGALAGFTLALQNTKLIALTGSITGIAAALSMAASEYLSTKSEEAGKNPVRASFYTGIAYISTVVILIFPYMVLNNVYLCLALALLFAALIIGLFNYYISVAKDLNFKHRFFEMTALSFSVATLSFFIGFLLKSLLPVDI